MTWGSATLRSMVIVVYFVVATVWVPNAILQLGAVANASAFIRDTIVLAVWAAALFGGLYGLWAAQRKGLI